MRASPPDPSGCTTDVDPADLEAHIAKVKAAWRHHQRTMEWEQKIAAIERMREGSALLACARQAITRNLKRSARLAH